MESKDKELMFDFMKWFIHKHRKNIKYEDKVNAIDFSMILMSKLCSTPVFGESVMDEEFESFLKERNS